jgi:hypothetical protein
MWSQVGESKKWDKVVVSITNSHQVPLLCMHGIYSKYIGECVSRWVIEHASHDKVLKLGTLDGLALLMVFIFNWRSLTIELHVWKIPLERVFTGPFEGCSVAPLKNVIEGMLLNLICKSTQNENLQTSTLSSDLYILSYQMGPVFFLGFFRKMKNGASEIFPWLIFSQYQFSSK